MSFLSASYTQRLDAAGEWRARLPLTDPRAAELTIGRIFLLYREGEGFIGAGLIHERNVNFTSEGDLVLEIGGPTMLGQLRHLTTLKKALIEGKDADSCIQQIIQLRSELSAWLPSPVPNTAWGGPGTIAVRMDAETILEAILKAAEIYQVHVRENVTESAGALTKRVEVGAFGASSGVTIQFGHDLSLKGNSKAAVAESVQVMRSGNEIWNRLIIQGSGEGEGAFTPRFHDIAPNLVANPSFEKDLASWTQVGGSGTDYTRSRDAAADGTYSAKLDLTNTALELYQEVTGLTAGQAYSFECQVYTTHGISFTAVTLEYRSASAVLETATIAVNPNGKWKTARKSNWIAPTGTIKVRIRLQKPSAITVATHFDRVRFFKAETSLTNNARNLWGMPKKRFGDEASAFLEWYIEDQTSIDTYGLRERYLPIKNINIESGAEADVKQTASALLWKAIRYLNWVKDPQDTYQLGNVYGLDKSVKVGDKLRLRGRGMAEHWSGQYVYLDIDAEFWLLERTDEFREDGSKVSRLTISNIDRPPQDTDLEMVVGDSEGVSHWRRQPQSPKNKFQFPVPFEFSGAGTKSFKINIDPDIFSLLGSDIRISGSNITSVKVDGVSVAADDGGGWGAGGGVDAADIAPFLMNDEGIASQGDHTIEVAVSGAGTVQVIGTQQSLAAAG
ncbi:MAG TPA: carbohydrate binding domain-containing protein [Dehalococcoidia bacterium]|nr:carbohydrate binding domain-containing protein [Dehalococcoidia bacterium]